MNIENNLSNLNNASSSKNADQNLNENPKIDSTLNNTEKLALHNLNAKSNPLT